VKIRILLAVLSVSIVITARFYLLLRPLILYKFGAPKEVIDWEPILRLKPPKIASTRVFDDIGF